MEYVVRKATHDDCPTLAAFLQRLVSLRNEPGLITQNAKDLQKDGFSKEKPKFAAFLAETAGEDKEVAGFALYSYRYACFVGRGLHLNNLFVLEQHRGKGVATQLLKRLIRDGLRQGCRNMGFMSNSWNFIAKNLYKKMGAVDLTETKGLHAYELVHEAICTHVQPIEGVFIRKASPEDVPEMTRLLNRFRKCQKTSMVENVHENVISEGLFRPHPKFFSYVAEKEATPTDPAHRLVGVLTYSHAYCSHSSTTVSLDSLFVEEAYRRKGIGCALFKECLHEEGQKRHTKVRIFVDSSNESADVFLNHVNAVDQSDRAQWIWSLVSREDLSAYADEAALENGEAYTNGDVVGNGQALTNGDLVQNGQGLSNGFSPPEELSPQINGQV